MMLSGTKKRYFRIQTGIEKYFLSIYSFTISIRWKNWICVKWLAILHVHLFLRNTKMFHESRNEFHIFFGGHLHHHHVQEVGGITHYQLPSLAGTDRWHAGEGYVTSDPALVAYMIDKTTGVSGFIQTTE